MKKFASFILTVIFLSAILSSCKKSDTTTTSLIGDWHRLQSGFTYYFKITDNSNYNAGYDIGQGYVQTVTGTYTSTSSSVTFNDATGDCVGVPGTYNYTISDTTMVLTLNSDACTNLGVARSDVVVGTWTK